MQQSITIQDSETGTSAEVLPGLGFNCFDFTAAPAGRNIEMLWAAPRFAYGTERPTRSGIPILFPFAGRIRGTSFEFRGRTFPLEVGDDFGNAIHGFVLHRPWRVVSEGPSHVRGEFQASVDDPALLDRWPADFRISVEYKVAGYELACAIAVTNPDDRPLPFTLGTHPYFRVPLGGASAEDCIVRATVADRWQLVGLLPTGKTEPAPMAAQLAAGMKLEGTQLDDVFTGLGSADGTRTASLHDPDSGRTMVLEYDKQFKHCVIFNPPHREAICIEPYTGAPNPFDLHARGIDGGLAILEPQASVEYWIRMRLE